MDTQLEYIFKSLNTTEGAQIDFEVTTISKKV